MKFDLFLHLVTNFCFLRFFLIFQELANFIQKESGRQVSVSISPSGTVTSASLGGRLPEHRVIITTASNSDAIRQVGEIIEYFCSLLHALERDHFSTSFYKIVLIMRFS